VGGGVMKQLTLCFHCQQKVAFKAELAGRRLVCPHCKQAFVAPSAVPTSTAETDATDAAESSEPEIDSQLFLSEFPPKSSTSAAKTPAAASGKGAVGGTATSAKKAQRPLGLYIGLGVGGAVVVIGLLIALVMSLTGGGIGGNQDIRYGLTRAKRKQVFMDLVTAADKHPAGDVRWREIRDKAWGDVKKQYGIDVETAEKILDEGFTSDWKQPAPAGTAAGRMGRIAWIGKRTQERGIAPQTGSTPSTPPPKEPAAKTKKTKR
jgi:hypothetical protein